MDEIQHARKMQFPRTQRAQDVDGRRRYGGHWDFDESANEAELDMSDILSELPAEGWQREFSSVATRYTENIRKASYRRISTASMGKSGGYALKDVPQAQCGSEQDRTDMIADGTTPVGAMLLPEELSGEHVHSSSSNDDVQIAPPKCPCKPSTPPPKRFVRSSKFHRVECD